MIRLRPIDDHVIIKWDSVEKSGPAGLTPFGFEKPRRGTILALGPGRGVRVGDEVLFPRTGGIEVQLDGEDCIILRESDILAVVVPVAPVLPRHDPAKLHPDVIELVKATRAWAEYDGSQKDDRWGVVQERLQEACWAFTTAYTVDIYAEDGHIVHADDQIDVPDVVL